VPMQTDKVYRIRLTEEMQRAYSFAQKRKDW
jgi:hypothetical protein